MKTKWQALGVALAFSVLAFLLVPAKPAGALDPVQVSIGTAAQVAQGKDFIVKVNIGAVSDFDVAQYDVNYTGSVLNVTSVTAGLIGGTAIPVSAWGQVPAGVQGKTRVIQNVEGVPGVAGSGYLAEIHFRVVGSVGSSSAIDLNSGVLGDKNAQEIQATWTDGSVQVSSALTADFSANKTEVLVGEAVAFAGAASGGTPGYSYAWDFDSSGSTDSTAANPTYSYSSAGAYSVSLVVTDSLGDSANKTRTSYVTVYPALTADFSASKTEATVGENVTFTGTVAGGKTPHTYAWDFDSNGSTDSTAANPTYAYLAAGTYSVSLTVTDSLSHTANKARTNYVTAYPPLTADFSASETEVMVGESVVFTSSVAGGKTPYTYAWDFDNSGSTDSALANPAHAYSSAGTYSVSFTVTDSLSQSASQSRTGYITVYQAPTADFSANKTGAVVGESITFTSSVTGGKSPSTYAWDLDGDGTTDSTVANPTRTYSAAGTYAVTLTVTDSLGHVATKTVAAYITVYRLGDANGNGVVNSIDITYVEHVVLGSPGYAYTTWADANQDGNANALDITAMEIMILGG